MNVVVLGGSSASTPALFRCLGARSGLPPLEVRLVGRSREHLEPVVRASRTLLGDAPVVLRSFMFTPFELASALSGADLVVVQVRFGGYEGRHFDETFPLQFGLCGDEGLGPGGLAAAWRAWPAMRNLLAEVESGCPEALVLMMAAPLGIFVGSGRQTFPNLGMIGICELPWTTLQQLAALLEVDFADVDFDYAGLNHLGWFYRINAGTRNLLAEYRDHAASRCIWPSAELVAACGGFPTKYLRLHYDPQQVLDEQRRQQNSRARALKEIALDSYRTFESGNSSAIVTALERRPTPWYEHAVVPFLLALAESSSRAPFFLTGSYDAGRTFAADLCEAPVVVAQGRLCAKRCSEPPPPHIVKVLRSFAAYERQAVSAVVSGNADGLREALAMHPWVDKPEIAAALTREITGQLRGAAA